MSRPKCERCAERVVCGARYCGPCWRWMAEVLEAELREASQDEGVCGTYAGHVLRLVAAQWVV